MNDHAHGLECAMRPALWTDERMDSGLPECVPVL